jgi:hypothetical protein
VIPVVAALHARDPGHVMHHLLDRDVRRLAPVEPQPVMHVLAPDLAVDPV